MPENEVTPKKEVKEKINLEKYQDLEGVSLKKLEFGLWYLEHQSFFYKLIVLLLVAIGAASWSYTIYSFTYYLARGMDEDNRLTRDMVASFFNHEAAVASAAKDLAYRPITAISLGNGKYDIMADVSNINLKHWSEFEYEFIAGGRTIFKDKSYILPGTGKSLVALNQEVSVKAENIQLAVSGLSWQRLDARTIPDWKKFYDDHYNVTITDAKFTPAKSSGLSEKINLSQVEFTVTNNTAYNYWRSEFFISLYNRGTLIGINKYYLENFLSGNTKEIKMSWPGVLGRVDQVEVKPEINILDKKNYLKFE